LRNEANNPNNHGVSKILPESGLRARKKPNEVIPANKFRSNPVALLLIILEERIIESLAKRYKLENDKH
jgi:hypothetical protein